MSKRDSTKNPTEVDLEGMQELNRRLVDAMGRKDLDQAMACFWNDPDLFIVLNGTVLRGPDAARAAFKALFDQNESIKVEANDVSYVPSGDGVLAVGTATYTFKPTEGPPGSWSNAGRISAGRSTAAGSWCWTTPRIYRSRPGLRQIAASAGLLVR